jgi:hypothetical protein
MSRNNIINLINESGTNDENTKAIENQESFLDPSSLSTQPSPSTISDVGVDPNSSPAPLRSAEPSLAVSGQRRFPSFDDADDVWSKSIRKGVCYM